ncbi:MAG: hypothetical protein RR382_02720 [Tannerellaceae bacterium]
MAKEIKQGENLLLQLGTTCYAAAESMSFEITTETRKTSTYKQMSGGDGKFVTAKAVAHSWSAQTDNALMDYADYKELADKQILGEPIDVDACEATVDSSSQEYTKKVGGFSAKGKAIITSISCSAPKDGDVTVSIKLEGTGAIAITAPTASV